MFSSGMAFAFNLLSSTSAVHGCTAPRPGKARRPRHPTDSVRSLVGGLKTREHLQQGPSVLRGLAALLAHLPAEIRRFGGIVLG